MNANKMVAEGGYYQFSCLSCAILSGYRNKAKWVEVKKPGEELWDLNARATCPACGEKFTQSMEKMDQKQVDGYLEQVGGTAQEGD